MAINLETQYPGKVSPSSADYPYGSARNITLPGDGTGTPWEAAIVNDNVGFQQSLLDVSGQAPSATPEKVGSSQYLKGVSAVAPDVATLAASKLKEGQLVATQTRSNNDNRGAALYLIKTAAQAATDGDVIDELQNITIANTNVAIMWGSGVRNFIQFGFPTGS